METPAPHLGPMLELAVPIAIQEVIPWGPDRRIAYCQAHAQDIASRSDVLMFGGKRGEAGKLFGILARCLACLAFQPGGVRFAGAHWAVDPVQPDPVIEPPAFLPPPFP